MNNKLLYGLIGLIVGAVGMGLLNTTSISHNKNAMMDSEGIDAHFIEQMVPHHEGAITMSKLAEQKAKRPEVKQLAKNIIASQSKEIDQMKKWYSTWFAKELTDSKEENENDGMMGNRGIQMGMMGNDTDMNDLKNANDFDRTFIEEMIPHHQMAIMMATMLKAGTTRPEMQKLADSIIAAQTAEITQMKQWLIDWK
ncbi:DUF305 domain-containing protein [soil metagenome]